MEQRITIVMSVIKEKCKMLREGERIHLTHFINEFQLEVEVAKTPFEDLVQEKKEKSRLVKNKEGVLR